MLKYKFFCNVCNREVKRKEVMPVVERCTITPTGFLRKEIVRAFHFPNCKGSGELDILILEGKQVQTKITESGEIQIPLHIAEEVKPVGKDEVKCNSSQS